MSFQGQIVKTPDVQLYFSTGISLFTSRNLMGFYPQKHVMKYPGDVRRLLLAVLGRSL